MKHLDTSNRFQILGWKIVNLLVEALLVSKHGNEYKQKLVMINTSAIDLYLSSITCGPQQLHSAPMMSSSVQ